MAAQPGQYPLTIGRVTFNSEECPEEINLGAAEQMEAVHNPIGGSVVSQSFGVKPHDVAFEGQLFDGNIDQRIADLRAYMTSGLAYDVSYRKERYSCKVRIFEPKYHGPFLARYAITLSVIASKNGAFSSSTPVGLDDVVTAAMQNAISTTSVIAAEDSTINSSMSTVLANLQQSITSAGPLAQLSGSNLSTVINNVTAAINAAQIYLGGLASTDSKFIQASQLVSYLQLVSTNIARGQTAKSIQQTGGDLYSIAAQVYGDATLAFALAAANGMSSPSIPSRITRTIVLPPFVGSAS